MWYISYYIYIYIYIYIYTSPTHDLQVHETISQRVVPRGPTPLGAILVHALGPVLTLLEPQSRFWDKLLEI